MDPASLHPRQTSHKRRDIADGPWAGYTALNDMATKLGAAMQCVTNFLPGIALLQCFTVCTVKIGYERHKLGPKPFLVNCVKH